MYVERVLESCLYAEDLPAGRDFYSQVLELKVHSEVPGRHVFFQCGQGMFLLFNSDATSCSGGEVPPHGAHGSGHIAFAIQKAHLPAWREHLERHGVAVETEIAWPGGGCSIYFRDPAGNSVELATAQVWGLPLHHG